MNWQDILKSYKITDTQRDFFYRTEIKPNMYEYLPEADNSVEDYKNNDPEGFKLYVEDIFDYVKSKVSKEELVDFYRNMALFDYWDMLDDEEPFNPSKIQLIFRDAMRARKP